MSLSSFIWFDRNQPGNSAARGRRGRVAARLAFLMMLLCTPVFAGGWTHFSGDARRSSTRPAGPIDLDGVLWIAPPDPDQEFIPSSTPLVWNGRVYVYARRYADDVHVENELVCFNAATGIRHWTSPFPTDVLDSWSTPAVHEDGQAVIVPVANKLIAVSALTGGFLWQAVLARNIVNASPVVSDDLTTGGVPSNRCYITDFSTSITQPFGRLYAINVDPYDAVNNPHLQGDIVWQKTIGRTIGNSPAYRDGTVYAATTGGTVFAHNGRNGSQIWSRAVSGAQFMGGVTLEKDHVFVASYDFEEQGLLVKIRADNGYLEWVVDCERTSTNPIVCDDRIYVSGGIDGFGSVVNLQAFEDHGHYAQLLWETDDGLGSPYRLGSWNGQPARAGKRLYVSRPNLSEFFSHFTHLVEVNLGAEPGDLDFVCDEFAGAGGPPALHAGCAYSVGSAGLVAFQHRTPSPLDLGGEKTGTLYP